MSSLHGIDASALPYLSSLRVAASTATRLVVVSCESGGGGARLRGDERTRGMGRGEDVVAGVGAE